MASFCSNTIYKGSNVELHYYIDEDFSNLHVEVYTDGKTYVVPTATTIDEGLITMFFEGNDLDILNDGVIRYDVQYDVDGETIVRSICTNQYLKTPGGYSAITADEIYQEGYGQGYESGHTAGWQDGISDESNRIAQSAISLSFSANGSWQKELFSDVYASSVEVNVPVDDYYNSGYTDGYTSGASLVAGSIYSVGFNIHTAVNAGWGSERDWGLKINNKDFSTSRTSILVSYREMQGYLEVSTTEDWDYATPTSMQIKLEKQFMTNWGEWNFTEVSANCKYTGGIYFKTGGFKLNIASETHTDNGDYVIVDLTFN